MSAANVQNRDYAFLGAGTIAAVLVERLVRCGVPPGRISVSDAVPEKARSLAARFGARGGQQL